jgi:prepilin-type processing-associated H-X9-DG protein
LLTVIAIIGVLMAMVLPAVQQARETARRLQCASGLRQMGMAMMQFEDFYKAFPSGSSRSDSPSLPPTERFLWSGQILSFIDQQPLRESLELDSSWAIPRTPNYRALQTRLSLLRCPSAGAPERIDHDIEFRVPATYLACASGLVGRESGTAPLVSDAELDGVFFADSAVRQAELLDGTSKTLLIGESLYLEDVTGPDHSNTVQLVDHWYIGSPSSNGNEMSEAIGSTAVPINAWLQEQAFIEDIELGYSSRHVGGAQVVFADGHTQFIAQEIDLSSWSAMGTRMQSDLILEE